MMKNIAFYFIFFVIFVNSIASETLQDEVFKSVKTNVNLAKNETRKLTYLPRNSTSFFDVLQQIKRELDELTKSWKRQEQELVTKFSEAFKGHGFNEEAWGFLSTRRKRSPVQPENGFSEEIMRMIQDNFPCRDPQTLALIPSGTKYFNRAECSQCFCHMGKLSCEKNIKKCYPNACHLQDGEIVQNFAIHYDGCNNCLCYFGELVCTHARCPEAGHHYTNYKSMGFENVEPENNLDQPAAVASSTRKPDSCLECDHLTGSNVCGLKQWKTFPTLCHAMFCGKNGDEYIDDRGDCQVLDPCAPFPCDENEYCVPFQQSSCLSNGNNSLCHQFKCISKNMKCPEEDSVGAVCGEDNQSYESECEMLKKGVQLAYKGLCKKHCKSEVCGIESRTYASRCHANEVNAHVDYYGRCEYYFKSALMKDDGIGSSFEDKRCEMVYENGRCSAVKCETTVLPPGSCCPICGSALLISLNHKAAIPLNKPYRLHQLYAFLSDNEVNARFCKISVDFTYTMDILLVIQPYNRLHLDTCKDLAIGISDRMNLERKKEETGILAMLGAATLIKEKATERIDKSGVDNLT